MVSRRKKFTHKKGGRKGGNSKNSNEGDDGAGGASDHIQGDDDSVDSETTTVSEGTADVSEGAKSTKDVDSQSSTQQCSLQQQSLLSEHDCSSKDVDSQSSSHQSTQQQQSFLTEHDYSAASEQSDRNSTKQEESSAGFQSVTEDKPLKDLYEEVKQKVDMFLPRRWMSSVHQETFRLLFISAQNNVSVQRSLEFSPSGDCKLFVHCKEHPTDSMFQDIMPPVPLDSASVNVFVDRIVSIMNVVRKYEICSGYDEERYRPGWNTCPFGEVDKNPYRECRYIETFRSHDCKQLVISKKWRCSECIKLWAPLRRRTVAAEMESRNPSTNNRFLTEEQKLKKLQDQQQEIENGRKKLTRLHEKMQEIIKQKCVPVDKNMSDALTDLLESSDLTPAQSVFLQQQVKASQLRNSSSMKWHPTMIRLALAIHLTSPAAYELVRQTGMIKLPSSRTLFDYSHAHEIKEGIDSVVIEKLAEKIEKLSNEKDPKDPTKKTRYKKYHVLMADEMYISQNLVFDKFKGKLLGFTSLDNIEQEVKHFEDFLDNPEKETEETPATKIMVYMVKGVSNGVKEVVATFASNKVTATQMKVWTWKVIGALERSGVAVIAFVCDGSATNRAFIKKHKPATVHPSGVIFDTINKCARDRILYFISDVPHLLKTIRNCLLNSKWDKLKSRRRMMKNGKRVTWDFITKLYNQSKGKTLRKSFKLNAMNVNPDSYARMKVKYAGEAVSKTVCTDMRSQNWPEASETALFLEKFNDWFDCLNGAHSSLAKKKRNPNLAPYTSVDDERFGLLDDTLLYLEEWKTEAENPNSSICSNYDPNATVAAGDGDMDQSEIEGEDPTEENTPASRRQLSRQTLEGIYMTTLAFRPMVTFLLNEGTHFINARVFTQDPLEQHFSKLRAGHGGSNNPNLQQCLKKNRAIHIFGELGIRKRKGNSGEDGSNVEVTTEPLAKRKCSRIPKFLSED